MPRDTLTVIGFLAVGAILVVLPLLMYLTIRTDKDRIRDDAERQGYRATRIRWYWFLSTRWARMFRVRCRDAAGTVRHAHVVIHRRSPWTWDRSEDLAWTWEEDGSPRRQRKKRRGDTSD